MDDDALLAQLLRPLQIPPPTNWQDFETLCHDLWRDMWQDMEAQKNGRTGQSQCGVDIFGRPGQAGEYAGVQCKGKDRLTEKALTADEMSAEVKKARRFKPPISALAFATVAPRDARLQEAARKMTARLSRRSPFTVSVWSWDDISEELYKRPHVLQRHYPQFFCKSGVIRTPGVSIVEFDIFPQSSTEESLGSLFASPAVRALFSEELRLDMQAVVAEFVLNAASHGDAHWCSVRIESDRLTYSDDGVAFNPLDKGNLKRKQHGGARGGAGLPFIRYVLQAYGDKITTDYRRIRKRNVLAFVFKDRLSALSLVKNCRIWLRAPYWPGKSIKSVVEIPRGCQAFTFTILPGQVAISHIVDLVLNILSSLPANVTLHVSIPWSRLQAEFLKQHLAREKRIIVHL